MPAENNVYTFMSAKRRHAAYTRPLYATYQKKLKHGI